MKSRVISNKASIQGFTLVEMLAALTVVSLLGVFLSQMLSSVSGSWTRVRAQGEQFRNVHLASDYLGRRVRQATLKTYWDYYYASTGSNTRPPAGTKAPDSYARSSELHFLTSPAQVAVGRGQGHAVFFQAPFERNVDTGRQLDQLLAARGFWVEFGDDSAVRPPFVTSSSVPLKYRYRLVEFRPPSELGNLVYLDGAHGDSTEVAGTVGGTSETPALDKWFRPAQIPNGESYVRPVVDNVIALLIRPRGQDALSQDLAPGFIYDSSLANNPGSVLPSGTTQHVLPPLLDITLVTIDEASADLLQASNGSNPPPELGIQAGWFQSAAQFDSDLAAFEQQLIDARIDFRIAHKTIHLQESKWSF